MDNDDELMIQDLMEKEANAYVVDDDDDDHVHVLLAMGTIFGPTHN
jgi:hypothetical protein